MPRSTAQSSSPIAHQGATANRVIHWFEDYIKENKIQIGDALPSEDQIVEMTGISRTCVREAITRLRSIGIVESRRKRGMRLTRSISLVDFVRMLVDDDPGPDTIGHIGGFRSALELGLVPEIFRCCGSKEIKALEALYKRMETALEDREKWTEYDREFHAILIGSTGNKMAAWFWEMLQPFFRKIIRASNEPRRQALLTHRRIIDGLRDKDPFAFEQAMRDHHLIKLNHKADFYLIEEARDQANR